MRSATRHAPPMREDSKVPKEHQLTDDERIRLEALKQSVNAATDGDDAGSIREMAVYFENYIRNGGSNG
jgi:hypothetical protein